MPIVMISVIIPYALHQKSASKYTDFSVFLLILEAKY